MLGDAAQHPTRVIATQGWRRVDPAEVGLDGAVLEQLAREAADARSHCLLVVRDGVIAGEWSWAESGSTSPQETMSVMKSVTALLVGAVAADPAVDLDLDDPVSRWVDGWRDTPSADVTVRHVLTGVSGREWSIEADFAAFEAAADRTSYSVGLGQEHPPGEVWTYSNTAIQALEPVLRVATGAPLPELLEERLLGPLGMDDSTLATDEAGNGNVAFGLQSTCRDLARFGLMVLDEGRWDDEQVIAADVIREATGAPGQDLNAAYGHLWWLNRTGPQPAAPIAPTGDPAAASGDDEVLEPARDGRLVPGAPEDLIWALGAGDQVVQVHHPTRTVVIRLGPPTEGAGFGPAQTARVVTEAVLEP